ncbi:hypothetical protein [Streptomyces sp. NPDC088725]|uniref:hypothetical protein n=1 Tax=Streptomyces sp. NPDC088725 TaxID=3365873 RepID=UPI0038048A3C
MAGLTALALAGVGFLAVQASANAPDNLGKPKPPSGPAASAAPAPPKKDPLLVPEGSGTGQRVVYALHDRRVWLVGPKGERMRTFAVMPSTLNPVPGSYAVTSRTEETPGSDGVTIEHVVRFTTVEGVTIGFSAAVDGSMPSPDPKLRTGGVRMQRADGDALWSFASVGSKVVVVP